MPEGLRYTLAGVAVTAFFTFLAIAFPNVSRVFTIPGAVVAFGFTLYFLWPEVRAFFGGRRNVAVQHFRCGENVYAESHPVESGTENPRYFQTIFYLVVGNALADGQTLRRTQSRFHMIGEPVLLRVKETGANAADIRHGEWVFFEIGRVVSNLPFGAVHAGEVIVDADKIWAYDSNVPRGLLSFEVHPASGSDFGLMYDPTREVGKRPWEPWVVVSADDAKAMNVRLNIDFSKIQQPVTCKVISG